MRYKLIRRIKGTSFYRITNEIINIRKLVLFFPGIIRFCNDFIAFNKLSQNKLRLKYIMPCLYDVTKTTNFDSHYIYHPAWAANVIAKTKPKVHHDFSSILSFSTVLSAFVNVEFYDYRPAKVILENYKQGYADLINLPFPDNSLESISCMHTIEHVGLGRYGDKIDPNGDLKALSELRRVLKNDGNLLLVIPIGKSRIMFNGQRIYGYEQFESLLHNFTILDFKMVPDDYTEGMISFPSKVLVNLQTFACGCFWLKKH